MISERPHKKSHGKAAFQEVLAKDSSSCLSDCEGHTQSEVFQETLVVASNPSRDEGGNLSACHFLPHPRLLCKPGLRCSGREETPVLTQCTTTWGPSSLSHGHLLSSLLFSA